MSTWALLMSTCNKCLPVEIRKIFTGYSLFGAVVLIRIASVEF